ELLLIAKDKTNLTGREKEIEHCLEKINPDNLVDELAKISSPEFLS
ncbi:23083_t:CDS:1, partial [Racocetra persica]